MQTDYRRWDLSLTDWLIVGMTAAGCGMAVGWLFYDSRMAGWMLAAALIPLVKKRYVAWRIERRQAQLRLQFRDLLYSISSSIAVGRNMTQALEESISFWQGTYTEKDDIIRELTEMTRRIRETKWQDTEALNDFAQRSGIEEIGDFVRVYETCRTSGANLIKATDQAATMIGDKIVLEKELHTLMAQKRFEGRIVMMAPFLVMLFLKIVSPGYLTPLTASPQGYMISSVALGLILIACALAERVNRVEN